MDLAERALCGSCIPPYRTHLPIPNVRKRLLRLHEPVKCKTSIDQLVVKSAEGNQRAPFVRDR